MHIGPNLTVYKQNKKLQLSQRDRAMLHDVTEYFTVTRVIKMVSLKSSRTVSYSNSIATVTVSCIIS